MTLKISILILAFITAVTGIGSNTWVDSAETWFKKITARGWVALTSLSLALILGVVSEIRSAEVSGKLEQDLERKVEQQKQLANDLKETKEQLKSARAQLETNGSILEILENASKDIKADSAQSRKLLCEADANGVFDTCKFHIAPTN